MISDQQFKERVPLKNLHPFKATQEMYVFYIMNSSNMQKINLLEKIVITHRYVFFGYIFFFILNGCQQFSILKYHQHLINQFRNNKLLVQNFSVNRKIYILQYLVNFIVTSKRRHFRALVAIAAAKMVEGPEFLETDHNVP